MNIVNNIDMLSIRQFKSMMNIISSIEAEVYPSYMFSFDEGETKADLKEFCESTQVMVMYTDSMYCICTPEEVVDLCSKKNLSMKQLLEIKTVLKDFYGTDLFGLDARETTSYKLIKFLEYKKELVIYKEELWYWGSERFISLQVQFV